MNRPPKPPRIPKRRDELWRMLRIVRRTSLRDLAALTDRPGPSIQRELQRLRRTGYAVLRGRRGARGKCTWSLVRNTGPKPPLFLLDGTKIVGAVDRNTRQIFGVDGGKAPAIGRRGRHPWMPKVQTAPTPRALTPEMPS